MNTLPAEIHNKIFETLPVVDRTTWSFVNDYCRIVAKGSKAKPSKADAQLFGFDAAKRGDKKLIMWALKNGYRHKTKICDGAAVGGRVEMLSWVMSLGCDLTCSAIDAMTKSGDMSIEILDFIYEELGDVEFSTKFYNLCNAAIRFDRLDVLSWLNDRVDDLNIYLATSCAPGFLSLNAIEWYQLTDRFDMNTILIGAVRNSGVIALNWLRQRGHPTDLCRGMSMPCLAARFGSLGALTWMKDNGTTMSPIDLSFNALSMDRFEVIRWMIASGFAIQAREMVMIVTRSILAENIETLDCLKSAGVVFGHPHMKYAIQLRKFASMNWLYDNGVELNSRLWDYGCEEVVQWLKMRSCPSI
jgi:hypothetical protein